MVWDIRGFSEYPDLFGLKKIIASHCTLCLRIAEKYFEKIRNNA